LIDIVIPTELTAITLYEPKNMRFTVDFAIITKNSSHCEDGSFQKLNTC